jgi:hypothetical protein
MIPRSLSCAILAVSLPLSAFAKSPPASPELSAALAKAKACPLTDDGFDSGCEGYSKWLEDAPMFEEGKSNPALLGMVGNKEAAVRLLAFEKLRVTLTEPDAAAVETLLVAAAKETHPAAVKMIAEVVGGLDLIKTGKLDRAIAVAKAHPVADYSESFVFHVGDSNADPKLLAYADEVAKSKSSSQRNAALQLYSSLAKTLPGACKGLDALRADSDGFVSGRATSGLARSHRCAAFYDQLLTSLAALPTTKDQKQDVGFALDAVCDDKAASAAQKTKALAISKKISESTAIGVNTRYYTLSAVVKCDPKGGPAFVAKFKNDKEKTLAERAKSLAP